MVLNQLMEVDLLLFHKESMEVVKCLEELDSLLISEISSLKSQNNFITEKTLV